MQYMQNVKITNVFYIASQKRPIWKTVFSFLFVIFYKKRCICWYLRNVFYTSWLFILLGLYYN